MAGTTKYNSKIGVDLPTTYTSITDIGITRSSHCLEKIVRELKEIT